MNFVLLRAAFLFSGTTLGVTAKGQDFAEFRSHFGPDDRGFGYIKIMVSRFTISPPVLSSSQPGRKDLLFYKYNGPFQ